MNRRGFVAAVTAVAVAPWLRSVVRPAAEARIGAESGLTPIEDVRRRYFPSEIFRWDDSVGPIWTRADIPPGPDRYVVDFSTGSRR